MKRILSKQLVGLTVDEFNAVIYQSDCIGYIASTDSVMHAAPDGYMANRVNVAVVDGKIARVYGWG